MSNIFGSDGNGEYYQMGFYQYNFNTDGGTGIQFVPALKVSFVDVNGFPVEVTANEEDHVNGVLRVPYHSTLRSLVPPTRLATYWITNEEESLSANDVIERLAQISTDTEVHVNANYKLTFVDGEGKTIDSDLHSGTIRTGYAATHSVGMKCIFSTINLDGYTELDYTYELNGKTYDRLGLYAALQQLNVAKDAEVKVKVSGGGSDINLLDIYGNRVEAGKNYYIKFPGRGDWYLTGSITAKNTYVKLEKSTSYVAPGANPKLYKLEGNANYVKIIPTYRSQVDGKDWYVASDNVSVGYDRAMFSTDTEMTLIFRADPYTNYTNAYSLAVANHNGTGVLYFANYSGTGNNMGFDSGVNEGTYVQFIPYISGLTLNFKTADGTADQPVIVYRNDTDNGSTKKSEGNAAVTSIPFNVTDASSLSELQQGKFFYETANGVSLNVVKYRFNDTDYFTWDEVLSAAGSGTGAIDVWLTNVGVQPLDIFGSPVVEGKAYRIIRYSGGNRYLTKSAQGKIGNKEELLTDGTQNWTVVTSNDFATLHLRRGDDVVYANEQTLNKAGVAMLGTGTEVAFATAVADQRLHYYFLGTTDVASSYAHLADGGVGNNHGFRTNARGNGSKFAFVPVGAEDAYGATLTGGQDYRIEMPAKVGTSNFPDGQPITLTPRGNNSSVAATAIMPASISDYRTYYWLPETYDPGESYGLKYMYNDEQVWQLVPVEDNENTFYLKNKHGYVKTAKVEEEGDDNPYRYNTGNNRFTFVSSMDDATPIVAETAEYDGLKHLCGLYVVDSHAKKYYLMCQGTSYLGLTTAPKSGTRWFADCLFQFKPVKGQDLATAYANGNVKAKGFDCFGPGKTSKGLKWNATNGEYEEPVTSQLEEHNWLKGLGDKNDSIVGYRLPNTIYLAYDASNGGYQETIDFATPELIGYEGTVNRTKTDAGYYEYTGYHLENYPILASPAPTVVNGSYKFSDETNWYMIVLRQHNERLLINCDLMANVRQDNLENPFVDRYLFCFVGNEKDGYLVYNKAHGPGHFMGAANSYDGKRRAMWNQAHNVVWLDNDDYGDDVKNRSRIVFQVTQHDYSGYYTFVDRYSGYSLDRWSDYVVYWQGRHTHAGGSTTSTNGMHNNMTDYDRTQNGQVPNAFSHDGGTYMEARLMGFPSVSETYSRLLKTAMESGYLSSMIGYVGLFRSQEELDERYEKYLADVAALYANSELSDAEYAAKSVDVYNNFFKWLTTNAKEIGLEVSEDKKENQGAHYPLKNGVEFRQDGYYMLRNASNGNYLAVTAGSEGANSYSLTTVADPSGIPGAIWYFDKSEHMGETYASELGNTQQLRNVYWNSRLTAMSSGSTATLALEEKTPSTVIDVYNDMTKMENPGQFVLRTAVGGEIASANVCLSLIDGNLVAASEQGGGGESRWYLIRVSTEKNAPSDTWTSSDNHVEEVQMPNVPGIPVNSTNIPNSEDKVYFTYCNTDRDVAFPHNMGITAFRADGKHDAVVHFIQLADETNLIIPKGTGILLRSPNGLKIPMLPVSESAAVAAYGNTGSENRESLLEAVSEKTPALEETLSTKLYSGWAFVYKNFGTKAEPNYIARFYKIDPDTGLSFSYHRAYVPESSLASIAMGLSNLGFETELLGGAITDVYSPLREQTVASLPTNSDIYDLQGRRVTQPQAGGVYIVNGQKVLFK